MNFKLFLLSVAAMVNAAYGTTPLRVELGGAADFVILAKAGITNVVGSNIVGDIGVSPIAGTSMTGFELPLDSPLGYKLSGNEQVTGKIYAPEYLPTTDVKMTAAVSDMEIAYADAAGRAVTGGTFVGSNIEGNTIAGTYSNLNQGDIGGLILTAGVYDFGLDVTITDYDLTFSGSATDIFIIKTTKSVKQAANTKVILGGNALAKNIFWQVAETFEVGAKAEMKGTLLVKTAVTFITESKLEGRILSQTSVALQMATITETDYTPLRRGLRGLQVA
jgi:hypothetical protein